MPNDRQQLIAEVFESMGQVRRSFKLGQRPVLHRHGLGLPHFHMLFNLAQRPQGVSVNELAERAGITAGAVTQIVDRLAEKGMIERVEDPDDRRVVRIKLTDKAKTKFSRMKRGHHERMEQLFQNLSDDDLRQLARIISKLKVQTADASNEQPK